MSIDDEVRRVSDAVAARVREDVARELQAVLESRSAPVAALRPPPRDDSQLAVQQLAGAIPALSQATSLTGALDALATAASEVAARVALLLVDDAGRLSPWRMSGFGPQADGQGGEAAEWALTAEAAGEAAESLAAGRDIAGLPEYVLDGCLGKRLLVPISIEGKAICALYADQGWTGLGDTPAWGYAMEALALHASKCLEVVTLRKTVEVMGSRPVRVAPGVPTQSGARGQDDPETARRFVASPADPAGSDEGRRILSGRARADAGER
jgi:hypothetical protein